MPELNLTLQFKFFSDNKKLYFLETNVISAAGQTGSYIFHKKALDKCGVLTYNRDRKSIPVDGLLPC